VAVVFLLPCADSVPRLGKRREQRLVEAFIAEAAVEALDKAVLHGFAGSDIVPVDLPVLDQRRIAMLVNSVPLSLTTVSGRPRLAMMASSSQTTRPPDSYVSTTRAKHSRVWSVHHGQHAEAATVCEGRGPYTCRAIELSPLSCSAASIT